MQLNKNKRKYANKGGQYWFRTASEKYPNSFEGASSTGYNASQNDVTNVNYYGFAPFGVI